MTDQVIPIEAVEAVARQVFFAKHGLDWDFVWFAEEKRAKARQDATEFAVMGLQAALPHLRPPICGDVACPGLGNCEDPDCLPARCEPLLKTATDVALKLGRQEAAEEIAKAIEAEGTEDDRDEGDDFHRSIHFATCAQLARDTGKGDS